MDDRLKQALCITAYENIDYLIYLLDTYSRYFKCYVHIDRKCKITDDQLEKMNRIDNVIVVSKYKIYWGSYAHIIAIMELMRLALKDGCYYLHIISANTLPVKHPDSIIQFYKQNKDCIFMETICRNDLSDEEIWNCFDYRCKAYFFHDIFNLRTTLFDGKLRNLLLKIQKVLTSFQVRLKLRNGVTFNYKGYVYCHLPMEVAEMVLSFCEKNKNYIKTLKRCYVGEEFFFQNIIMNSNYKSKVVNSSRIFDIWGGGKRLSCFSE